MTHTRYWTMTFAVAIGGAFLAIERFAFAPSSAIWIAFGVAAAAVVFSIAAALVGLLRDNQRFSGLSAMSALVAGWTVIATRVFTTPTALWLAFAGGIVLLALSLRALALHETTIEQVVHQLDVSGSGEPRAAIRRRGIEISGRMRSWLHWLGHTGIGLAGAFIVASTFIWPHATAQLSPRWLAFGLATGAASIGLGLLLDSLADARRANLTVAQTVEILLTTAAVAVAGAVIVLTAAHGIANLRWWTFGLGAGLAGISLVASTAHELSSERVRHELEVAQTTTVTEFAAVVTH
jgi:hypothetical protein